MGLFRRNKKSKIDRGSLPSSLPNASTWSGTASRQEQGGTKTNIHDTSPIMSATDSGGNLVKRETTKGSGSLPKPFVKTSGNHFQDFRTLLAKSKGYYELGRYEDVLECEDVILRLISEKGMNPSQRALSLHTKANCYYFLNRLTESKKCLLEVLEFDPYNEEALTDLHDTEMKIAVKERTEKNNTSSQESESIFCENCGKPLKPTAKFCGKCGTPRA